MDALTGVNMNATEIQIDLHSFHSDVYKEVYNIRPRWLRPEDHTAEEWQAMIDELLARGLEGRVADAILPDPEPLQVKFPAFKLG